MMDMTDTLEAFRKLAQTDSESEYQYYLNRIRRHSALEWIALFLMRERSFGDIPASRYTTRATKELIVHLGNTKEILAYDLTIDIARKQKDLCTKHEWWLNKKKPLGRAFQKLKLQQKINVLHESIYFDDDWFEVTGKNDRSLDRSSSIWMLFSLLEEELEARENNASKVIGLIDGLRGCLQDNNSLSVYFGHITEDKEKFESLCYTRATWQALFDVIVCTLQRDELL